MCCVTLGVLFGKIRGDTIDLPHDGFNFNHSHCWEVQETASFRELASCIFVQVHFLVLEKKHAGSNTSSLFWLEQVEVWLWLMLIVISMPTQSSVAENGHHGKHPAASWWIMDHETRETTAWTTRWDQLSIRSILRVERRFSMTKFFWCLSRL